MFDECDEQQAEYGMPPHEDNERCGHCTFDIHKYDGETYTELEARELMFILGERSKVRQDEMLATLGADYMVSHKLEGFDALPAQVQAALVMRAWPKPVDPPAMRVEGAVISGIDSRDPRKALIPGHVQFLRTFYRRHGRLPAVITVSFTEEDARENNMPTRIVLPEEFRVDLAYRFDIELKPEIIS